MEESIFLTKFASEVNLIHRRDKLRASKIMQDRAFENPKIKFHWNTEVKEVVGSKASGVTALNVQNVESGHKSKLDVEGLFIAIGHHPNTEIFRGQIDLDEMGYIKSRPGSARTNIDGVFACGDVQDPVFKQAITAAGTGCMAAIEAERWLSH